MKRTDVDSVVSEGSRDSLGEGGGVRMRRSGGKEVGKWTLKHASAVRRENKSSISDGRPKLLQSFLGFPDFLKLGHDVKEDRPVPRS